MAENMPMPAAALEVDLSGMRCPLPVLRTKKALTQIAPGELLRVLTTDDDSRLDIPAFVKQAGHTLEEMRAAQDANDRNVFHIRKTCPAR